MFPQVGCWALSDPLLNPPFLQGHRQTLASLAPPTAHHGRPRPRHLLHLHYPATHLSLTAEPQDSLRPRLHPLEAVDPADPSLNTIYYLRP